MSEKIPIMFSPVVVLPGVPHRIPLLTRANREVVSEHLMKDRFESFRVGVVPRLNGDEDLILKPGVIGAVAIVHQISTLRYPAPCLTAFVNGVSRFKVIKVLSEEPYPTAIIRAYSGKPSSNEIEKAKEGIAELIKLSTKVLPVLSLESSDRLQSKLAPSTLLDICAGIALESEPEKYEVLRLQFLERLEKFLPKLARYVEGQDAPKSLSSFRELVPSLFSNILDKRMAPVKDSTSALKAKIESANLPPAALEIANAELSRLQNMTSFNPEAGIITSYLELMASLPWSVSTNVEISTQAAQEGLEKDHYALDQVKRRVLEYLAVKQLKGSSLKAPILCFVGPPGVGKTSICQSIAKILGRKFERICLGGVSNQSDIRGHRRTYIGSMPGRIIQALKSAKTNNPVILLDEIDKLGTNGHGNPNGALLEVLDPEQNHNFIDHYLNTPFDLSQVIFIATANSIKGISRPLRDRMELIDVSGYTLDEKLHILKKYLLPKQVALHGLQDYLMDMSDDTAKLLIAGYTSESGVRALDRALASICRDFALKVSLTRPEQKSPLVVTSEDIIRVLGAEKYDVKLDKSYWEGRVGVAIGLAYTESGGCPIFIETSQHSGSGIVVLTGNLGLVMKESANIALSWLKKNAAQLKLKGKDESNFLDKIDVHVHVPAGAIEKEGPSAGIALATALVSLFTDTPILPSLAMTGELTLQGNVLPIGGVKEKLMAAQRLGVRKVLLPSRNKFSVDELPKQLRESVEIVWVSTIQEVLMAAFGHDFHKLVSKL